MSYPSFIAKETTLSGQYGIISVVENRFFVIFKASTKLQITQQSEMKQHLGIQIQIESFLKSDPQAQDDTYAKANKKLIGAPNRVCS